MGLYKLCKLNVIMLLGLYYYWVLYDCYIIVVLLLDIINVFGWIFDEMVDIIGWLVLLIIFIFGKYWGKVVVEIVENDSGYLCWLFNNFDCMSFELCLMFRYYFGEQCLYCCFFWQCFLCQGDEKGVFQCYFFIVFEVFGFFVMFGIYIGVEQQQVIVGFQFLQFCYLFSWFLVLYLGIMQIGSYQYVGICLCFYVVIGIVVFYIVIIGFILWIFLFFKFIGGQWNSFIQYGGYYIDEWYLGYYVMEQFWLFIYGYVYQYFVGVVFYVVVELWIVVFLGKQCVIDVQIVVEGIFFIQEFIVFILLLIQFVVVVDVGDGVDKVVVEQVQLVGVEIGIDIFVI